jgi:hypothetical protein
MVEDKYGYENFCVRGGFKRHLDFKKIKKHYAGSNFLMAELKSVAKLWNFQSVAKMGNLNSAAKMGNLNSVAKWGT